MAKQLQPKAQVKPPPAGPQLKWQLDFPMDANTVFEPALGWLWAQGYQPQRPTDFKYDDLEQYLNHSTIVTESSVAIMRVDLWRLTGRQGDIDKPDTETVLLSTVARFYRWFEEHGGGRTASVLTERSTAEYNLYVRYGEKVLKQWRG